MSITITRAGMPLSSPQTVVTITTQTQTRTQGRIRLSQPSSIASTKLVTTTRLYGMNNNNNNNNDDEKDVDLQQQQQQQSLTTGMDRYSWQVLFQDSKRNVLFSILMILCGAVLGPFLDTYHSAFGVLQYDHPITMMLWNAGGTDSSESIPALITAWWVPELFGIAGFIIGWLYIILDHVLLIKNEDQPSSSQRSRIKTVSPPLILFGISYFTFQYWFSGVLYSAMMGTPAVAAVAAPAMSRGIIFNIMSVLAALGFVILDGTWSGFITSTATAIGGPMIEVILLSTLHQYHYTDPGEFGYFPLWIVPVYFLGGPANGNLARGFWTMLSAESSSESESSSSSSSSQPPGCQICHDSRCVECPNCDDASGYYLTYGQRVKCNACKGRGLVICRTCFHHYGEDPADIDAIRNFMSQIPD